jgi:hypothetical protein
VALTRLLAQMTVTDLDAALEWYGRLFDGPPDSRPMGGLAEWHLAPTFGVQVWQDPDRAGHSTMVIDTDDIDAFGSGLDQKGIGHDGVQDASSSRILPVTDPDGNRIVFTGP